ncbi:MAG: ABC transporter substrate-binding protein [Spirochaetia bacterium]|nr:ABC transporter substrate-binding protein [Spirochaetia bacterium]
MIYRCSLFKTKIIILIILLLSIITSPLWSKKLPVIRISVENTSAHVQTASVKRFAQLLEQRLASVYEIEFYPSASLFKDADIFRALAQGKVEIAVPGTWHFDKLVPDVGMLLLPSFYGRDASVSYSLMESNVGKNLIATIEKSLDVKVLGRFIDLGHTHIFSSSQAIYDPIDFVDKKIRVAGGHVNSLRIETLGAKAVTIAWPSLPLALKKKTIDALLTSYETITSAHLDQYGIKHVYEDKEYFAQYIPITSTFFWNKLSKETQQIILTSWQEIVDQARLDALEAQYTSKALLESTHIQIVVPSEETIIKTRETLLKQEASMAHTIGITPENYTLFRTFFDQIDGTL